MFRVGDRVLHRNFGYEGRVVSVEEDGAYLRIIWDPKYRIRGIYMNPIEDITLLEKKRIKPYGIVEFMNKINRKEYV